MGHRTKLLPFSGEPEPERDLPELRPMARTTDPGTSHVAAATVRPSLGKIQRLVLQVFEAHGPMTARAAERRDEFSEYGFSTIRKRISELAQGGHLVADGVDTTGRAPCTIYRCAGDDDDPA